MHRGRIPAVPARRRKSREGDEGGSLSGLAVVRRAFTARLKSCPDTKHEFSADCEPVPMVTVPLTSSHTDSSRLGSHGRPGQVRLVGRPSGPREPLAPGLVEALALPALKRVIMLRLFHRALAWISHRLASPGNE